MKEIRDTDAIVACTQRISALTKHFAPTTVVKINGIIGTVADVIAVYQACLDERAALSSAQAHVKTALASRDAADEKRHAIEEGVRAWIVSELGAAGEGASDFGVAKKSRRAPSVATLVAAHKKADATRKARGTKGKRQRLEISGAVDAPSATNGAATNGAAMNGSATTGAGPH